MEGLLEAAAGLLECSGRPLAISDVTEQKYPTAGGAMADNFSPVLRKVE
jgi:hypothetical protein